MPIAGRDSHLPARPKEEERKGATQQILRSNVSGKFPLDKYNLGALSDWPRHCRLPYTWPSRFISLSVSSILLGDSSMFMSERERHRFEKGKSRHGCLSPCFRSRKLRHESASVKRHGVRYERDSMFQMTPAIALEPRQINQLHHTYLHLVASTSSSCYYRLLYSLTRPWNGLPGIYWNSDSLDGRRFQRTLYTARSFSKDFLRSRLTNCDSIY